MLSISPRQAYSFRCSFSQQLRSTLPSKFISFHSFNPSGGFALLISSSAIPSCEVHVLFLPFSVGVLPKLYKSYSFSIYFNRSGFNIYLITKPLGSRRIPCSSFLTECFQLCSSSLFSFFHFSQHLKVHGFTHLSKKQLCFTSPLPFLLLSGAILDLGTRSLVSGGEL